MVRVPNQIASMRSSLMSTLSQKKSEGVCCMILSSDIPSGIPCWLACCLIRKVSASRNIFADSWRVNTNLGVPETTGDRPGHV